MGYHCGPGRYRGGGGGHGGDGGKVHLTAPRAVRARRLERSGWTADGRAGCRSHTVALVTDYQANSVWFTSGLHLTGAMAGIVDRAPAAARFFL